MLTLDKHGMYKANFVWCCSITKEEDVNLNFIPNNNSDLP